MDWKLIQEFAVGGTTDVGFSSDSCYLLVASSQGRGLYETTACSRVARDHEWPGEWHNGNSVIGIGPCQGMQISVNGLEHPTPEELLNLLANFKLDSHVTEFIAAAISSDGKFLVLGYSSDVQLYKRT